MSAGSASKEKVQVFLGVGQLHTLAGAASKSGRRPTDDDLTTLSKAAFVVSGGRITWIGEERNLPASKSDGGHATDLGGATVIPALVESHTHLVYAGNRAAEFERRNRGESYQSIAAGGGGILSTVRATREASVDELARLAQERADRFARQGVATIEIKSGYGLTVEHEMKMLRAAGRVSGPRIVRTFLGAHAIPKEESSAEAYLARLENEALPLLKKEGLACRVDVFVEKGYFEVEASRRYLQAAKKMGFDLAIHADQLTRSGGAQLAVELGARSAEHLICINDEDVASLSASETTCVLLPSADLYMNCAYPPARKLIDGGARVALATDVNPGSSPSLDVALVGVLARVQMRMTLTEVLVAYTVGAAHALGLGREAGSLEVGKFADFAVVDGHLEDLFLEVGLMPVTKTAREGQWLGV